ncbi:tetratricopeptide repeat protein [Thermomonas flagellata]|uniref:tetratricopeptide repeat protein n=1 Tax=Thermomonas flagellata TaxID=2888524 RepID=UPI001F04CDEA|nr:tetratricopeptide repeat protein [Thermomonas flagellata]
MPTPRRLLLPTALLACMLGLAVPLRAQTSPPSDPLQSSLVGEFALQDGRLQDAARAYLEAARAASDPVLAERATRIALLAVDDALAGAGLALWQRLQPEGSPMQRTVAASLALRAGDARRARPALAALLADGADGWKQAMAALMAAVGSQPALVTRLLAETVDGGRLPPQLDAWLAFGGLAQRLGQPALVDRVVAQVVRRFPGDPRVQLLQAQLAREAGRLDEARRRLAALRPAAAAQPALQQALALEYDALGDPATAAAILAAGPQDEERYGQRAFLLDKAKDKAGLAALYDEVRAGASQPNPARRLLLGQLAEYLGRYREALDWYDKVPGGGAQVQARLRRPVVLHALGRADEAYAALRALQDDALLEDADRRNAYLLEADLRQKDGDRAGEEAAYARGLAAFADDKALLYARALMWERRDDIARAEADFRRILVVAPDDVDALNALGYTLADRTDRYREALQLIDRARLAAPGNAAIIDSYGWVLFRLGRLREALEQLRQAYALQQDAEIAAHLGQVLWALGRHDEARRYFDEARRLDPDNRALARALRETGA